jgi:hypothetical protein
MTPIALVSTKPTWSGVPTHKARVASGMASCRAGSRAVAESFSITHWTLGSRASLVETWSPYFTLIDISILKRA